MVFSVHDNAQIKHQENEITDLVFLKINIKLYTFVVKGFDRNVKPINSQY